MLGDFFDVPAVFAIALLESSARIAKALSWCLELFILSTI